MNTSIVDKGSVLIPVFKKIALVRVEDILYIEAMQNYSMIYMVDDSSLFVSLQFGKLLDLLAAYPIYQSHKSYAVNLKHVEGYHYSNGIELRGGVKVLLARRRRKTFLNMLNQ